MYYIWTSSLSIKIIYHKLQDCPSCVYRPVCNNGVDFLSELNNFFGRFEAMNNSPAVKSVPHQDEKLVCIDIAEV